MSRRKKKITSTSGNQRTLQLQSRSQFNYFRQSILLSLKNQIQQWDQAALQKINCRLCLVSSGSFCIFHHVWLLFKINKKNKKAHIFLHGIIFAETPSDSHNISHSHAQQSTQGYHLVNNPGTHCEVPVYHTTVSICFNSFCSPRFVCCYQSPLLCWEIITRQNLSIHRYGISMDYWLCVQLYQYRT